MAVVSPSFPKRLCRAAGYVWASPVTLVGMGVALLAVLCGARTRLREGVLETSGGHLGHAFQRVTRIEAITIGHVVLGVGPEQVEHWRTHERAHVSQYERYGVFMPLLYALESLRLCFVPRRHHYWDNRFEREARLVDLKSQRSKA